MSIKIEVFKKAYKKLKSNVYFDKTALILRNKIVEFESDSDIDYSLEKFDETGWNITSVDYNYKLLDDDVSTEYEIKFREKGTLINRAIIEKGDDHNGN